MSYTVPLPPALGRVDLSRPKLLLPRASDRKIGADLKDMLDATCRPYMNVPEVRSMMSVGLEVVRNTAEGRRLRAEHDVRIVRAAGRRRIIGYIMSKGDWWLWIVPDSASHEAEDGSNDFVDALVRIVDTVQPGMIAVAEFKRLVRSFVFGGQTFAALRRNRTMVVEAGMEVLDPTDDDAKWSFAMKTTGSDVDRTGTVERLLHGQLQAAENGLWPWAEEYLPDGYRFRRDKDGAVTFGVVERDPSKDGLVEEFVRLGATDLSNAEIARALGPKGLLASRATLEHRARTRTMDEITVDALDDPGLAVRKKYERNLDIYLAGRLPVVLTNRLPYRDHVRGLVPDPDGKFRYVIDLGGPHPAVTADAIAAARRRRLIEDTAHPRTGAAASDRDKKPFCGLGSWEDGAFMYQLAGPRKAYYHLLRRPLEQSYDLYGRQKGFPDNPEWMHAVIRSDDLHRSFADAVLALDPAVAGHARLPVRVRSRRSAVVESRLAARRARLSELDELIAGALQMAQRAAARGDLDGADVYDSRRRAHEAERAELVAQSASGAEAAEEHVPERADFGTLATVVAGLQRYPDQAPPELSVALAALVRDMRLKMTGLRVDWSATLLLNTDPGGEVTVTVSGSVPDRRRNSGANAVRHERTEALARRFLADGLTIADVARDAGMSDVTGLERRIRDWLAPHLPSKGLRGAVMDCPIPEVRQVVWASITRTRVPDGIDMGFARHVESVYTADHRWSAIWAADTHVFRRAAVAAVGAYRDPSGMPYDDLAEQLGASRSQVRVLLDPYRVGSANRARPYGPSLERTQPWGKQCTLPRDEMRVRLITCGHCGAPATHVLRVPEVPGDLLCRSCRRAADPRYKFRYPEGYFLAWHGPRGTGSGRTLGRMSGTVLAS